MKQAMSAANKANPEMSQKPSGSFLSGQKSTLHKQAPE